MRLYKILLIVSMIFILENVHGQDIHWSMFDMAPLSVNPAYTGDYEGSFRIGGNYRGQWNSVSNATGFTTPSLFVDAPLFVIGQSSWIGLGGTVYYDKAGTNQLSNFGVLGSIGAHIGLSRNSVLSLGFQGGIVNRRLNTGSLLLEEQIVLGSANLPYDDSLNGGLLSENPSKSFSDLIIGLKFYNKFSKNSNMTLGMSARHIASNNNFLQDESSFELPLLLSFHGKLKVMLNDKWSFLPGFIYQKVKTANQLNVQVLMGYKLNKKSNVMITTGIGYRAIGNDAVQIICQLNLQESKIGLSYDINISELSDATNNRGAIELAFTYTGKRSNNSKFKSRISCPRF